MTSFTRRALTWIVVAAYVGVSLVVLPACSTPRAGAAGTPAGSSASAHPPYRPSTPPSWDHASADARGVAVAAERQVGVMLTYDAAYVQLPYPNGDVPQDRGACTDVVIRAFRGRSVDLQRVVHEDMAAHFSAYPQLWGLKGPDTNIDHRRVPNLQTFFTRKGKSLPVTKTGRDYWPGDVVTWETWGKPHTGVVSTVLAGDGSHHLIANQFGQGAKIQDILFAFPITGHYRWF